MIREQSWRGNAETFHPDCRAIPEPMPSLRTSEGLLDIIEKQRHRVRELQADAHRITSALSVELGEG
jgi:hypothetical protein